MGWTSSVCPRLSSFVLPCWGRETGERPTIYLRGGASVTSLVTPASRFAPFTSVCLPPKSGVVWTVGWLAVFRLRWGDRRVGPDEASVKEMDPEPFERDGTTRNWARTCRLPLFVFSSIWVSVGLSVGLLCSVYPRPWFPEPLTHLAETETGFYLIPNHSRSGD